VKRLPKILSLVLFAGCWLNGTAEPWTAPTTPHFDTPADFVPAVFSEGAADGFWAVGGVKGNAVVVKFDAAGNRLAQRFISPEDDNSFPSVGVGSDSLLRHLADGGVLVTAPAEDADHGCVVSRLAADGSLLWQTAIANLDNDISEPCRRLELDGSGTIWVATGRYSRRFLQVVGLRSDGTIVASVAVENVMSTLIEMRADPVAAGVILAGDRISTSDTATVARALILRLNAEGAVDWAWESSNAAAVTGVQELQVSASGGIIAISSFDFSEESRTAKVDWLVQSLTLAGTLRFEQTLHFAEATRLGGTSSLDAQGLWMVLGQGDFPSQTLAARLALTGTMAAPVLIANANGCARPDEVRCLLALRHDQGLWLLVEPTQGSGAELVGLDASGSERARLSVNEDNDFGVMPDDRALGVTGGYSEPPSVHRLGFDQPSELWPRVAAIVPSRIPRWFEAFASDGAMATLNTASTGGRSHLSFRPSETATVSWQVELSGVALTTPVLSVSGTVVCLAGDFSEFDPVQWQNVLHGLVQCWRRSDGSVFWQGSHALDQAETFKTITALDDGRVVAINGQFRSVLHRVIGSSGQLLAEQNLPELAGSEYAPNQLFSVAFNAAGEALLISFDNVTSISTLHRVHSDGSERFRVPIEGGGLGWAVFAAADSAILFGNAVARYASTGQRLWRHELATGVYDSALGTDHVWLALQFEGGGFFGDPPPQDWVLMGLDLGTGNERWRRTFSEMFFQWAQIESRSGNRLAVLQTEDTRLRLRIVDGADGRLLREQTDGCGGLFCDLRSFRLRDGDLARARLDTFQATEGWGVSVMTLAAASADLPTVRADQDGVSGAWYAPWSSGQGLVIDWIASGQTLFAPWFTYTTAGGNDPSALRWYSLQGVLAAPSTVATLDILSNEGGSFGVGVTAARRVGSAMLNFESCDRANLRYQFDAAENDGATGLVTLSRLTPGVACSPSGATAVAAVGSPKAFDTSFEGSWFEPQSSGQGLMFTLIPAAETLFATWFTYDPAAAADDPAQQHWFSLQGQYGAGDQVTVSILRTIGGAFDLLATGNTRVVGTATITRTACDHLTLHYQFDDSDVAAPFRGLAATKELLRIGGCE